MSVYQVAIGRFLSKRHKEVWGENVRTELKNENENGFRDEGHDTIFSLLYASQGRAPYNSLLCPTVSGAQRPQLIMYFT